MKTKPKESWEEELGKNVSQDISVLSKYYNNPKEIALKALENNKHFIQALLDKQKRDLIEGLRSQYLIQIIANEHIYNNNWDGKNHTEIAEKIIEDIINKLKE